MIVPLQSNSFTSVQCDLGARNTAEPSREICGSIMDQMSDNVNVFFFLLMACSHFLQLDEMKASTTSVCI